MRKYGKKKQCVKCEVVSPHQSLTRHHLLRSPEVSHQGSHSVIIARLAKDNDKDDDDDENEDNYDKD